MDLTGIKYLVDFELLLTIWLFFLNFSFYFQNCKKSFFSKIFVYFTPITRPM